MGENPILSLFSFHFKARVQPVSKRPKCSRKQSVPGSKGCKEQRVPESKECQGAKGSMKQSVPEVTKSKSDLGSKRPISLHSIFEFWISEFISNLEKNRVQNQLDFFSLTGNLSILTKLSPSVCLNSFAPMSVCTC